MIWYKLQRKITKGHVWAAFLPVAVWATQTSVHWNTRCCHQGHSHCKPGNALDCPCRPHPSTRDARSPSPTGLLDWSPSGLRNWSPTTHLCFSFIFIEIPHQMTDCSHHSANILDNPTQQVVSLIFNEQRWPKRNELLPFRGKNVRFFPWTREQTDRLFPWLNFSQAPLSWTWFCPWTCPQRAQF